MHTHTPILTLGTGVRECCRTSRSHTRHHCPPWCLFVHPSSSPPAAQRVNVYSGLGLQPSCLEPLGSRVRMPFLAGHRAPWRASPAPDPQSEEGAPRSLPCQKTHHHHLKPPGPISPVTWREPPAPLSLRPPPTIIAGFIRV